MSTGDGKLLCVGGGELGWPGGESFKSMSNGDLLCVCGGESNGEG